MLYLPDSVYKELDRLAEEGRTGRMDPRVAGERLVTMCPEFLPGYSLLEEACIESGDPEGAVNWLWRAMEHIPATPLLPFMAAATLRESDRHDRMARRLSELAAWKLSREEEVPSHIADHFRRSAGPDPKLDFSDPETFAMLAAAMEAQRNKEGDTDTPEMREKLLPHRLFNELQQDAGCAIEPELLEEFREHAGRLVPILHNSLRAWARFSSGAVPVISLAAALLGELGPVDHLPDLIELAESSRPPLFLHVHWAIYRIGQRFPDETLAILRGMIPGAKTGTRCAIAEQLTLLGDPPGIASAFRELLDGFAKFSKEHDAPYLLMSVLDALPEWEDQEAANELASQYLPTLSRDGRKWIQEYLDGEEEFMPLLMDAEIDGLTIEEICGKSILLKDVDEDDEYYEEDDEDDEDDDVPAVRPARPGRNDPCWCGSGKKYKKCHLEADEAADRSEAEEEDASARGVPAHRETGELIPQLLGIVSRSVFAEAAEIYFRNDPDSIVNDPEQEQIFIQWLLFDYRLPSSGRTVVEEFLKRRGHNLSQAHRQQLEAWREAQLLLVEVQRVDEGRGIEVKDLLEGGVFFVDDVTSSREAVVWDGVLNRIERHGERREFSGNGLKVARDILPDFLEWIETERRKAKQSAAEFVAANSHRLHRVLRALDADRLDSV
jgi:hypothetical protein